MRLRVRELSGVTIGCRVREATGWLRGGLVWRGYSTKPSQAVWDASQAKAQGEAGWTVGVRAGVNDGCQGHA